MNQLINDASSSSILTTTTAPFEETTTTTTNTMSSNNGGTGDHQSTTPNVDHGGGGVDGSMSVISDKTPNNNNNNPIIHPSMVNLLPTTICSMSPPFSSSQSFYLLDYSTLPPPPQQQEHLKDTNTTIQHQFPLDEVNPKATTTTQVAAVTNCPSVEQQQQQTPVNKDRNKKFSFSSITSVSDSGTESIVDEELIPDANEKILDYFARDNSKTVKLARRRLSANYREAFSKSRSDSDEQYDSDDESTLSESSFPPSPTEYGTPRSEAIFDFDSVCAAIDEKLGSKQNETEQTTDHQMINDKNNDDGLMDHDDDNEQQSPYQKTIEDNEAQFNNILDEYCDKDRRQAILTRSTSLKSGKTPPGTPGRKKIVRFADAMGLDLASVRHIVCDAPYVPPLEAFKSLELDEDDRNWLIQNRSSINNPYKIPIPNLCPNIGNEMKATLNILFGQPSSDPVNFLERVRSNKVCLENCLLSGPSGAGHVFTITCLVRVLNICFQKQVVLRYTTNEWLTWNEVPGTYVNNSNDGFSDKFTVKLEVAVNANGHQIMMPGQRLLFAIRFMTDSNQEYWDNNVGLNYALIYQRC